MQGGTDMTSDNIGDALLARRKQRRLDQGRAAAEIGVSPSTYRSYEKNTQRPSVNVFPSLSKFLGLEIEDFLPLYAATVIFALRPALERELASQGNGSSGDGAYVRDVEPAPSPASENHVGDTPTYVAEVDDDDFFGEETSTSHLGSVDEQVFIAVEEPSANGDFVVEVIDIEEVDDVEDDDEDDEDDEDEDEDEDDDEDDVESELVSVMAINEVMAAPSVSQFTSMPADFQKSTKQKKKKKKNKKR
jgi:transcriptional regulator with XRE-family HTH domain